MTKTQVSGHASRPELITLLAPKILIPMHTVDSEEFKVIAGELKDENDLDIEVCLLRYREEIQI